MKFFYYFYTLIIVLTQTVWVIQSSGEIEDMELTYLSHKLSPIECLRLLEAVYLRKPMTDEDFAQTKIIPLDDESLLRRQLERPLLSHENCRIKLEEWIHRLPEKSSGWARVAMETGLRTLGRPDLAQYVKRNRRIVQYFESVTRNPRNAAKHPAVSHPAVSKTVQVTPAGRKFRVPPKEAVVQVYRTPQTSKATKEKSAMREVKGAHMAGARRSEDNDSRTRWTAFLILLGLIALTILATVFFAFYKKNRGDVFPNGGEKSCDDRCPLADRFSRKSTLGDVDVEQGTSTPCSPCGRRKRRGSSTQDPSRSPSSICPREISVPVRKPQRKKYVREKQQKLEKRRKRRCDKKCAGIVKKEPAAVEKVDKATKTWERKMSEKSQSTRPTMPRLDLKKFHEKIANILRKDDPTCKCCKCSVYSGEEKCQGLKNLTKKDICSDDKCQKFRLKSIAELCLSPEEKSPKNNAEDDSNRKKKEKKKRKKKDRNRDKDTDKEKESEKTSPENSPRSKDKRESKIKEKKVKKKTCNVEGACGRKTCHFRKPTVESVLEVDNKI